MVFQRLPQAYVQKAKFVYNVYEAMGRTQLLLPVIPTIENQFITSFGDQPYYLMGWPVGESEWIDYSLLGS